MKYRNHTMVVIVGHVSLYPDTGDIFVSQNVHMKCIPFYCNIAYELKLIGMKTKHIYLGYVINFL
jgi:hypothetical protein